MPPVHVHDDEFETQVLKADRPVLVDFWAQWCGPCRAVAPVLEELAGELGDHLKIAKVDTDQDGTWAGRLRIQSIPTLVLFKNGVEVDRLIGAIPKWALRSWLEPHLGGSS